MQRPALCALRFDGVYTVTVVERPKALQEDPEEVAGRSEISLKTSGITKMQRQRLGGARGVGHFLIGDNTDAIGFQRDRAVQRFAWSQRGREPSANRQTRADARENRRDGAGGWDILAASTLRPSGVVL